MIPSTVISSVIFPLNMNQINNNKINMLFSCFYNPPSQSRYRLQNSKAAAHGQLQGRIMYLYIGFPFEENLSSYSVIMLP